MRRTHLPSALLRPTSVLGLCVLVAIGACLNPRPEEVPGERDTESTGSAGSAAAPGGAAGGAGSGNLGSGGGAGTGGPASGAGTGGSGGGSDVEVDPDDEAPDAGPAPPGDGGVEVEDASP